MCGVFGVINQKEAARLTYLGLYALQHRGEESAGIITYDGRRIRAHKGVGLACDVFGEEDMKLLKGELAVGHVRYSTTGSSHEKNIQPFYVKHHKGNFAVAHNGNFTNTFKLHKEMEKAGSIFQTTMDTEIVAHLMARSNGGDLDSNVVNSLARLEGAYSLVMFSGKTLIGARDPNGFRPLCIAKVGDGYALSSETCAFDLINADYIRDVEPGEVVFLDEKGIRSVKLPKKEKPSLCVFEQIYFARPDSRIFDQNVYSTRIELGKQLARECPAEGDIVIPIPDSGNYAALGYAEESKIPFEMGIVRNHYIGRTFIQPSQFTRDFKVRVKLNPIQSVLKDKRVIVIEDSIVRGTTSQARVKALRDAGAKEIHMRITCPPIKSPCYYGIDFPTKKELIAHNKSVAEIRDYMKLDSLEYLSVDGMLAAMKRAGEEFCTACFTGKYPTELPKRLSKHMLEWKS